MTVRLHLALTNPLIGQGASSRLTDAPTYPSALDLCHSLIDSAGDTTMSNQYPPSNGDQAYWGQGNPLSHGGNPPQGNWNPPTPTPPPSPQRNWFVRHKVLTGLGALLVIGVGTTAVNGGNSTSTAGTSPSASSAAATSASGSADSTSGAAASASNTVPSKKPTKKAEKRAGLNTPVKDGNLQFVVTKVQTGVARVGDQYLGQKAQGQFVLISVTVTNVGKSAETFTDSDQKIKDAQGRTFSADSSADIYIQDNQVLLQEINPGNSARGVLAFDMPVGATPVSITLKDLSLFSGGTTVALK